VPDLTASGIFSRRGAQSATSPPVASRKAYEDSSAAGESDSLAASFAFSRVNAVVRFPHGRFQGPPGTRPVCVGARNWSSARVGRHASQELCTEIAVALTDVQVWNHERLPDAEADGESPVKGWQVDFDTAALWLRQPEPTASVPSDDLGRPLLQLRPLPTSSDSLRTPSIQVFVPDSSDHAAAGLKLTAADLGAVATVSGGPIYHTVDEPAGFRFRQGGPDAGASTVFGAASTYRAAGSASVASSSAGEVPRGPPARGSGVEGGIDNTEAEEAQSDALRDCGLGIVIDLGSLLFEATTEDMGIINDLMDYDWLAEAVALPPPPMYAVRRQPTTRGRRAPRKAGPTVAVVGCDEGRAVLHLRPTLAQTATMRVAADDEDAEGKFSHTLLLAGLRVFSVTPSTSSAGGAAGSVVDDPYDYQMRLWVSAVSVAIMQRDTSKAHEPEVLHRLRGPAVEKSTVVLHGIPTQHFSSSSAEPDAASFDAPSAPMLHVHVVRKQVAPGDRKVTVQVDANRVGLRDALDWGWIGNLIDIIFATAPRAPDVPAESSEAASPKPHKRVTTRLFLNFKNCAVYYKPLRPPRRARYAPSAQDVPGPQLVISIGMLRMGSNLMSTTPMQAFKINVADLAVYVIDRCGNQGGIMAPEGALLLHLAAYSDALLTQYMQSFRPDWAAPSGAAEEHGEAAGALVPVRRLLAGDVSHLVEAADDDDDDPAAGRRKVEFTGVHERLEPLGFIRIATLDHIDVFVKTQPSSIPSTNPLTAVEMHAGTLRLYSCLDSTQTLVEVLTLFSDEATASSPKKPSARGGPANARSNTATVTLKTLPEPAGRPAAAQTASLLAGVDLHAFAADPGGAEETKMDSPASVTSSSEGEGEAGNAAVAPERVDERPVVAVKDPVVEGGLPVSEPLSSSPEGRAAEPAAIGADTAKEEADPMLPVSESLGGDGSDDSINVIEGYYKPPPPGEVPVVDPATGLFKRPAGGRRDARSRAYEMAAADAESDEATPSRGRLRTWFTKSERAPDLELNEVSGGLFVEGEGGTTVDVELMSPDELTSALVEEAKNEDTAAALADWLSSARPRDAAVVHTKPMAPTPPVAELHGKDAPISDGVAAAMADPAFDAVPRQSDVPVPFGSDSTSATDEGSGAEEFKFVELDPEQPAQHAKWVDGPGFKPTVFPQHFRKMTSVAGVESVLDACGEKFIMDERASGESGANADTVWGRCAMRLIVHRMDVKWRLFGGYDWPEREPLPQPADSLDDDDDDVGDDDTPEADDADVDAAGTSSDGDDSDLTDAESDDAFVDAREGITPPPPVRSKRRHTVSFAPSGGSSSPGVAVAARSRRAVSAAVRPTFTGRIHTRRTSAPSIGVAKDSGSEAEGVAGATPTVTTARRESLLAALVHDYNPADSAPGSAPVTAGASGTAPAAHAADDSERGAAGARDDTSAAAPRPKRQLDQMCEVAVSGAAVRVVTFGTSGVERSPRGGVGSHWQLDSSVVLAIRDFEVLDCIHESPLRQLLGYWLSDSKHPRERGAPMLRFRLDTVSPLPFSSQAGLDSPTTILRRREYRLTLRTLPLRASVGQEAVTFVRGLVATATPPTSSDAVSTPSPDAAASKSAPSAGTASGDGDGAAVPAHDEEAAIKAARRRRKRRAPRVEPNIFFIQRADIGALHLKVDYIPTRMDRKALWAGEYAELVNLIPISGLELTLSGLQATSLEGWAQLGAQLGTLWAENITQHQLHKLLASINASVLPLRTMTNLGAGAMDLVLVPLRQYREHGQSGLAGGIRRGASNFVRTTAIETLSAASRVAGGVQTMLERADDMVAGERGGGGAAGGAGGAAGIGGGPGANGIPRVPRRRTRGRRSRRHRRGSADKALLGLRGEGRRSRQANQPSGVLDGLQQAYESLTAGLQDAAHTIVAVPASQYRRHGAKGAAKAAMRAVPVAVLRPLIGSTEAVSRALMGLRNALDPETRHDLDVKYKTP